MISSPLSHLCMYMYVGTDVLLPYVQSVHREGHGPYFWSQETGGIYTQEIDSR
jgi:hypothetical protein